VLRDFEVVHLDGASPRRLLVTSTRVGQRLPVHCSALGKVLIGCSDNATREDYDRNMVADGGLEAVTPATVVDAIKLTEQLRTVGGQGYAFDLGECEVGLNCVATPVHGEDGEVVAALSVSGPGFRLSEDFLFSRVLPVLSASSRDLSESLGFRS
jgi:DNA-binding IclR family transcriptional regulator